MKCPHCQTVDLVMSDRQGVEIDYCPRCRGVWLDRGELDKIIDRVASGVAPTSTSPPPTPVPHSPVTPPSQGQYYRRDRDGADDDHDEAEYRRRHGRDPRVPSHPDGHHPYRKKKSFLGELFDFD